VSYSSLTNPRRQSLHGLWLLLYVYALRTSHESAQTIIAWSVVVAVCQCILHASHESAQTIAWSVVVAQRRPSLLLLYECALRASHKSAQTIIAWSVHTTTTTTTTTLLLLLSLTLLHPHKHIIKGFFFLVITIHTISNRHASPRGLGIAKPALKR
jgi:hypothetical protein